MDVERETVVEAALATFSVALFIVILAVAGTMGGPGLSQQGAYTVVGGIVAFVIVMSALGLWLNRSD
ncbi:DUF7472 family protein [Halospeciosus flavus]|uniref:Transporter n=1 Tax=Halospeciosus flavus TaxID=3032283 RepID=A0ABD5Z7E3_9EURY|nr:hypothetical protein [Halospeciosus flavus]